jgi:hypothetical protein
MSVLDLQAMVPEARDRAPAGSRASKGCFNTGGGGGGGGGGDNISSLSVALCAK